MGKKTEKAIVPYLWHIVVKDADGKPESDQVFR